MLTHICSEPEELTYALERLHELVVKAANESGGYSMLVGPHSTKEQQSDYAGRIRANPRNYIAQPTLGVGLYSGVRLGRCRPHQRPPGGPTATSRSLGDAITPM